MLSRGRHSGPVSGTHTAAAARGVLRGPDAAGFAHGAPLGEEGVADFRAFLGRLTAED